MFVRRWAMKAALALALLIAAAGRGEAQSQADAKPAGFVITGLVITPESEFNDEFELRLFNPANLPVQQIRSRTQQTFSFQNLEAGQYYVEAEVPGFKKVRERVDVDGTQREANISIMLEAQATVDEPSRPRNLTGDETV